MPNWVFNSERKEVNCMDIEVLLTIRKIVRVSDNNDISSAIQIATDEIKEEIVKVEAFVKEY